MAFAAILILAPFAGAQKVQKSHVIGFYNLENLFDTYHDEGKNDYEYLPDGANQWCITPSWASARSRIATCLRIWFPSQR